MYAYYVRYPLSSIRDIRNIDDTTTLFENKEYLFLSPQAFQPGDIGIVESANGLGFVRVVREGAVESVASRFLIGKLDLAALQRMIAWHSEQKAVRKRIEQRVKDLDQSSRLKALAAQDSVLAGLLKELDDVNQLSPIALTATQPAPEPTKTADAEELPTQDVRTDIQWDTK